MYPRRLILHSGAYSHVFFRCHNRQMFLKPERIKKYLLELWRKYKDQYGIQLYEFIIMDNHAHFLIKAADVEQLGCFMRVVNSQLARRINFVFKRDSQAIRERYKSPIIGDDSYFIKTMQYIWMNRVKVKPKSRPDKDPYCSLSYRLNSNLAEGLLDSYQHGNMHLKLTTDDFKSLFKKALGQTKTHRLSAYKKIFTSSHTISSSELVTYRGEYLSSFSKARLAVQTRK